jgi:hypothetical protein
MTLISFNMTDQSLESKIKRASEELVKLVLSDSTEKISLLGDLTPKDLKALVHRVITHKDLSTSPLSLLYMQMPV